LCRLRIVYDLMDLYRQMGVERTPVEGAGLSE
jgi:hypothetical protein